MDFTIAQINQKKVPQKEQPLVLSLKIAYTYMEISVPISQQITPSHYKV